MFFFTCRTNNNNTLMQRHYFEESDVRDVSYGLETHERLTRGSSEKN